MLALGWIWSTFASHKLLTRMNPLYSGLTVLVSTFGLISVVRVIFEGKFYLSRYTAYWLGDVIFLTSYIFFMTFICKDIKTNAKFYIKPKWHLLVLVCTSIFSVFQQFTNLQNGGQISKFASQPSQWVHVGIIAILGYYVISLIPLIFEKQTRPLWAKRGATIAILAYCSTLLWDIFIATGPPISFE